MRGKKDKTKLPEDFCMHLLVLFKDIVSSLLRVHAMLVFDGIFGPQSTLCEAQQYTGAQHLGMFC